MDWRRLLFGFGGRLNRAKYWLALLILAIVWIVCAIAVTILGVGITASLDASANSRAIVLTFFIPVIPVAVGLWSGLALACKRLHDRNKGAVWLLLFWLTPCVLNPISQSIGASGAGVFVALVGAAIAIWGFVEIGCLKGTTGPNHYGPDPLDGLTGQ